MGSLQALMVYVSASFYSLFETHCNTDCPRLTTLFRFDEQILSRCCCNSEVPSDRCRWNLSTIFYRFFIVSLLLFCSVNMLPFPLSVIATSITFSISLTCHFGHKRTINNLYRIFRVNPLNTKRRLLYLKTSSYRAVNTFSQSNAAKVGICQT